MFVASAGLFVGGAIGMEMIAGIVVEARGVASIWHTLVQTVEETCEMLGIVVFLYALLDYIQRNWSNVQLSLPAPSRDETHSAKSIS